MIGTEILHRSLKLSWVHLLLVILSLRQLYLISGRAFDAFKPSIEGSWGHRSYLLDLLWVLKRRYYLLLVQNGTSVLHISSVCLLLSVGVREELRVILRVFMCLNRVEYCPLAILVFWLFATRRCLVRLINWGCRTRICRLEILHISMQLLPLFIFTFEHRFFYHDFFWLLLKD